MEQLCYSLLKEGTSKGHTRVVSVPAEVRAVAVSPQIPVTSQRDTAATATLVELPALCFVGFGREIKYSQVLKTPCERPW